MSWLRRLKTVPPVAMHGCSRPAKVSLGMRVYCECGKTWQCIEVSNGFAIAWRNVT